MAQSWKSKQRQHEGAMDERLERELLALADKVGAQIQRAATGRNDAGLAIVPPNRRAVRERLKTQIWEQVIRPYFIGAGDEPLIGPEPQSDYMRTIRDGVRGAIAIQLDRQIAIIRKYADETVFNYLTGPRPFTIQRQMNPIPSPSPNKGKGVIREIGGTARVMTYDPFHLFVYGDQPYRLSDRGWETADQTRKAIDALIDLHVPRGTSAVDMADMLVPYLWPEAAKVTTRTPYGEVGSYWARRLARTEITAASGRSLINYSAGNLYIEEIDWVLSHRHGPKDADICDQLAANGPYKKNQVPLYPAHPHDRCNLQPMVTRTPAQVTQELRDMLNAPIQLRPPEIQRLQGAFNPVWAVGAMLVGAWVVDVLGQDAQENAA
ncbi:MAG: hypothetical protein K8L91_07900 [Anaerolineae bacterium]|nr:hypothetical protein [Anaerolineae bacterium]